MRQASVAEAIQITEARACVEALVARHAALRATADDHRRLAATLERMKDAVDHGAPTDFAALDRMLHGVLIEISRHTVAGQLVTNLRNRLAHHAYLVKPTRDPPRCQSSSSRVST